MVSQTSSKGTIVKMKFLDISQKSIEESRCLGYFVIKQRTRSFFIILENKYENSDNAFAYSRSSFVRIWINESSSQDERLEGKKYKPFSYKHWTVRWAKITTNLEQCNTAYDSYKNLYLCFNFFHLFSSHQATKIQSKSLRSNDEKKTDETN